MSASIRVIRGTELSTFEESVSAELKLLREHDYELITVSRNSHTSKDIVHYECIIKFKKKGICHK